MGLGAGIVDYMAKSGGHLGTGGTDGLLGDVGPLLDEGSLQVIFGRVVPVASPGLKDGLHREVHWIQVRAAGRPHVLVQKALKICLAPFLQSSSGV